MRRLAGMSAATIVATLQIALTIGYQVAVPIMWFRRSIHGPFEAWFGRGFFTNTFDVVIWMVGQFVAMGLVLAVLEPARRRCVAFATATSS